MRSYYSPPRNPQIASHRIDKEIQILYPVLKAFCGPVSAFPFELIGLFFHFTLFQDISFFVCASRTLHLPFLTLGMLFSEIFKWLFPLI